jgi:hypothetical protein
MSIKVNEILTSVLSYLDEAITTEFIKSIEIEDSSDVAKLIEMVTDIRFQLDFTLMSSAVEIQELYDKYRNRPVEESNIEIRTLMDLAGFIKIRINDEYGVGSIKVGSHTLPTYNVFIDRLADLLTLHSNIDTSYTCQDDSLTQTMNVDMWTNLLRANPWLVAAVCIRLIPGYYIIDITVNKFDDKGGLNETRSAD